MNPIQKVGILGAGVMGGELAYVVTQAGIGVVLKDVDQKFLDAGIARCRQVYEFKVKRRRMTQEEMDAKIALVRPALDYAAFGDVDLVIEAVPENLELKQRVFKELDEICKPDAILASNTSALSISAIGKLAGKRNRIVGMHFFNPSSMMALVEIIKAPETSAETIEITSAAAQKLGKVPVECADSPGFIVNRLLCVAMLEAIRCEKEGLAVRGDIDNFLVKPEAGMPIGLFKMADQLGIDLLLKVMRILEGGFGARLAPPEEIVSLAAQGNLGVKTGRGFYDYSDPASSKPTGSVENRETITERVLTAVVAEARRLVLEGVATPEGTDSAMRNGALFKKPPFAYTEEVGGAAAMDARISDFAKKFGSIFNV